MAFENPIFIDIETVGCAPDFAGLSPRLQQAWRKKATFLGGETTEEQEALFAKKSGIFAEFGKVVVISMGYIRRNATSTPHLHVKGLADKDEKQLLIQFKDFLSQFPRSATLQLCGHNIKEFDVPYLCRRMVIHGIPLPSVLDIAGKKPWEVNHLDTMEMWKFGDYKKYTSLDLLTTLFDIPSSKTDMDGSEVHGYYYGTGDLEKITTYCCQDVIATAQVYRKLRCLPLLPEDAIKVIEAQPKKEVKLGGAPLFNL